MRVDALCDVAAGMAEDAAFCCLVGSGIIKQRRDGMPAVVSSMAIGTDEMHDGPPYCAVPAVIIRPAGVIGDKRFAGTAHVGFHQRQDSMVYRDDADAGVRLALCDADTVLTQMDVSFLQL